MATWLQCVELTTRHFKGQGQTIGIKINYEPLAEAQKAVQEPPGLPGLHPSNHGASVAHKSSGRLLRRLQVWPSLYTHIFIYIYTFCVAAPRFPSCSRIKYLFSKILMEPKKLSVQMPSNTQQVNQPVLRVICGRCGQCGCGCQCLCMCVFM